MKNKIIQIRADEEFLQKVEYMKRYYGKKYLSATMREAIENEYALEIADNERQKMITRTNWLVEFTYQLKNQPQHHGTGTSIMTMNGRKVEASWFPTLLETIQRENLKGAECESLIITNLCKLDSFEVEYEQEI